MNYKRLNYKKSNSNDHTHLQKDRTNLLLEKTYLNVDMKNIEFWRGKFEFLVQIINEQSENTTLIENELIIFKNILKKNTPPIEFVVDDEVILFIFDFLQEPWKNSIKLSFLAIIDSFVTNIKLPLLNCITDELIDSLISVLLDENLQSYNQYYVFFYIITKILRTSCIYSSDFAKALFDQSIFFKFATDYILSLKNCINDETKLISFINIIKIVGIWCQLDDPGVVDSIPEFISFYTKLFHLKNVRIDNEICFSLIQTIREDPDFLEDLKENGFLNTIWESVYQEMPISFGIFILSHCLIDEELTIKQSVKEMIVVNPILNISNLYLQKLIDTNPSDETDINDINFILETTITLIANYLNCIPALPDDVSHDELLKFIVGIFDHANFEVKNCTTFVILILFSFNTTSQLDTMYSDEFLELVFDFIPSGSSEVIEKAIDVFTTLLQKAFKCNDNIEDSNFFSNFVFDILNELLETDEYDSKARSLLDEYFTTDLLIEE